MKVFLGGTCNESTWRNRMIVHLGEEGLGFFNPVVDDWNEDAQECELREREECDLCLYTITPKMTGVYSIAEVIDDSNKRPEKTFLVILRSDGDERFTEAQWKSLGQVAKMVIRNGGYSFDNLKSAAVDMGKIKNNRLEEEELAEIERRLEAERIVKNFEEAVGVKVMPHLSCDE